MEMRPLRLGYIEHGEFYVKDSRSWRVRGWIPGPARFCVLPCVHPEIDAELLREVQSGSWCRLWFYRNGRTKWIFGGVRVQANHLRILAERTWIRGVRSMHTLWEERS
jgi:hypothetical protein